MTPAEPKALLIDYVGVLTASVVEAFSTACASIGVDSEGFLGEAFAASHAKDSPFVQLALGKISEEEFSGLLTPVLCRHATVPVTGHQFYEAMRDVTWDLDPVMTATVDEFLATGVPTVLVSNSWGGAKPIRGNNFRPSPPPWCPPMSGCANPIAISTCWLPTGWASRRNSACSSMTSKSTWPPLTSWACRPCCTRQPRQPPPN